MCIYGTARLSSRYHFQVLFVELDKGEKLTKDCWSTSRTQLSMLNVIFGALSLAAGNAPLVFARLHLHQRSLLHALSLSLSLSLHRRGTDDQWQCRGEQTFRRASVEIFGHQSGSVLWIHLVSLTDVHPPYLYWILSCYSFFYGGGKLRSLDDQMSTVVRGKSMLTGGVIFGVTILQ